MTRLGGAGLFFVLGVFCLYMSRGPGRRGDKNLLKFMGVVCLVGALLLLIQAIT